MDTDAQADGPLSAADFQTFVELLGRFCQHELDQWVHWRCRTTYGDVYIEISRKLPAGHPEAAYDHLPQRDSGG